MSYTRYKNINCGQRYAGAGLLANAAYALDGASSWTPATEKLGPGGVHVGCVEATITFPTGYTGGLMWTPDSTANPPRVLLEQINPGDFENADTKSSAVTVVAFSGGPTFRNQDSVTSPTWEDCFASAWAAANAAEVESDAQGTYVRHMPTGGSPMRTFTLSTDANGNPVGRS